MVKGMCRLELKLTKSLEFFHRRGILRLHYIPQNFAGR